MILPFFHQPVLLTQVIQGLNIKHGHKYIDTTIGGGGYSRHILLKGAKVLGIDRDNRAIEYCRRLFNLKGKKFNTNADIILTEGNFADLEKITRQYQFKPVSGIIFDLGLSTYQIEESKKGFSYMRDTPLDMRLGKTGLNATEIINKYSKEQLYEIFTKYSEELNSGAISEAVVRARTLKGPIVTTGQLVKVIDETVVEQSNIRDKKTMTKNTNRTTARIFQALRIAVNDEINNLKKGLYQGLHLLQKGGRLIVLSYHSLEDREVKLTLLKAEINGQVKTLTKKPIVAQRDEININPRSRSAKLRIAEKII